MQQKQGKLTSISSSRARVAAVTETSLASPPPHLAVAWRQKTVIRNSLSLNPHPPSMNEPA